ncbi:MAG: TrkH family potassium uptake protein [Muribaculaceae bacterium]|nr:TrkH family potassium uptake protein [Muribaculaceae bacterium]
MSSVFRPKFYINVPMLLRVVGWLLMILAAFMLFPTIAGLLTGDKGVMGFVWSLLITLGAGFGMMSIRPKSREMGKREAILLVSLTWEILALFGMLPFLFCDTHTNVTDAFFETMSGFTTTGMSALNTLHGVPDSIILWRCVTQWIGGMGIILFTLAVLPMLNYQGGMQMFNAEVTGITHDKLRPRVSNTAKSLWLIYIILTGCLTVLLLFSGMKFFDAVCYGLSIMSTGGFAVADQSVLDLGSIYVKIVVTVFMFLGGVNFSLMYAAVTGHPRRALRNEPLKWYVWWILIGYALFCLNVLLRNIGHSVGDFTLDPLFQAVSVISSTGITEPDFHNWGSLSEMVLIMMMMTGACAGSTSGGAKIDRFIVLFKFLRNEFYKMMHPSAVTTVCINGKGTSYLVVQKVLAFLFVYIFVIIGCGILLVIMGLPLKTAFFYGLSAISNAGIGTEINGISWQFSALPAAGKWLLTFVMLVGRLELFTVMLLFVPSFWRK